MMNPLFITLIASVSARNFLVNEGIERIAESMAAYRSSGIDSSSASALVSDLMGTYLDAPPISSFVDNLVHQVERQAMSPGGITNMKVDPTMMLEVMGQYKGAFDTFHAQADFEKFRKAVTAAATKFDTKKMVADAQKELKAADATASAGKQAFASFTNQPNGKQVVASAGELYNLHNQVFNLHLPAFNFWLNLM